MAKLLALDFDGTVYFGKEKGYRKGDVQAIREFQAQGNLVGLNTGRHLNFTDTFENMNHEIEFDFYICGSGAQLANKKEEPWKQKTIDFETIKKLDQAVSCPIRAFAADGTYYSISEIPNPFFDNPIHSVDELKGKSIYGMCFEPSTHQEAQKIQEQILKMNLPINSQVNHASVDISPLNTDKGTGLLEMAAHYDILPENIFAMGDGDNDAPAIKAAHLGFAISSGSPNLMKEANFTVESVAQAIAKINEEES